MLLIESAVDASQLQQLGVRSHFDDAPFQSDPVFLAWFTSNSLHEREGVTFSVVYTIE